MIRASKRILFFLLWVAVYVGALIASVRLHATMPALRAAARRLVEGLVSDAVPGAIEVGRIDSILPLDVTEVLVRDHQGRLVLRAERVRADLVLRDLLRGNIHIPYAEIDGGSALLIPSDLGVSIANAFVPPSEGPDDGKGPPVHVFVDRGHLRRFRAHGDVPGYENIDITDIDGRVSLQVQRTTKVTVYTFTGVMRGPYAEPIAINRLRFALDTNFQRGIDSYMEAVGTGIQARARFRLTRESNAHPFHIDIQAASDAADLQSLHRLGLPVPAALMGTYRGFGHLYGPPENLRLIADAEGEAGDVHFELDLRRDEPMVLRGRTLGVAIEKLVEGSSAITVAADATMTLHDPGYDGARAFSLEARGVEVSGFPLPSLRAEGRITDSALLIERSEALAQGRVAIAGRIGFDGGLRIDSEFNLPNLASDPWLQGTARGISGSIVGSAQVERVPEESLSIHADARLSRLRYQGLSIASGSVTARLRSQDGWVGNVGVQGSGVSYGQVVLGDVGLRVQGGPSNYHFDFRSDHGSPIRYARIESNVRLEGGTFEANRTTVSFDAGLGPTVGTIAQVVYADSRVRVRDLALRSEEANLDFSGSYALQGSSDMRLRVAGFELSRLGLQGRFRQLHGVLGGNFFFRGSMAHPEFDADFALENFGLERTRSGRLTARIGYHNEEIVYDVQGNFGSTGNVLVQGNMRIPHNALGSVDALLERSRFLDLNIVADQLNLAFVLPLVVEDSWGISGKIGLDMLLEGPLLSPNVPSIALILDRFAPLGWSPLRIKARGSYVDGQVTANELWVADSLGELLSAAGNVRLPTGSPEGALNYVRAIAQENYDLRLDISPRALNNWPRPFNAFFPQGIVFAGSLRAHGNRSSLDFASDLAFNVAGTVFDHPCAESLRPVMRVTAVANTRSARIDASIGNDNANLLNGYVESDIDYAQWVQTGTHPGVEPLFAIRSTEVEFSQLPWTCAFARGRYTVQAGGRLLSATPHWDFHFDASNLQIFELDGTGVPTHPQNLSLRVASSDDSQQLSGCLALSDPSTPLAVGISLCQDEAANADPPHSLAARVLLPVLFREGQLAPSFLPDGEMELSLRAQSASFAPVLALVPGIADADLAASGTLRARGTRRSMRGEGALDIENGTMRLSGVGQLLQRLEGRIEWNGNALVIPTEHPLRAFDDQGSVAVSGRIDLDGLSLRGADLRAVPDAFPARREGTTVAWISGQADARVQMQDSRLVANVDTHGLSVRVPDQTAGSVQPLDPLQDILVMGERVVVPIGTRPENAPYRIVLDASEPLMVTRNDFEVAVTANLEVAYAPPDVYVGGVANIRRGYFEIFGKRLQLQRGSIRFDGDASFNPEIDILAVYAIPGATGASVSITVSGKLDSIHIDFASSETEDMGEIMMLLLGGRRASAQGTASAAQQASDQTRNFVSAVMSGILSLGLRQQFGAFIPQPIVELGLVNRLGLRTNVDAFIPDFLRGFILGATLEGFSVSGNAGFGGGGRLELQLPYNLVWDSLWVNPVNIGTDLVFEP